MWVLLAVVVVIIGFMLRVNAMLVVTLAGLVAGFIHGYTPLDMLNLVGTGFAGSRSVTTFIIVLPVIGLLERYGLQQQARHLMGKLAKLSAGGVLLIYFVVRQATAALGMTSIGGPAQTVRPLIYPMAKAAAERKLGQLNEKVEERLKAHSAASDTVALFFGEDIFLAIGSILLITGFVDTTYGLALEPLQIALWAIPTGVLALLIHGARLLMLDRKLKALNGAVTR
ncbi:DUF969 domain-containing protein [Micrococcales bacterium 31B]|nr:DUF969 domain-containing protein [Micrococcales bacterium 31B]